jgi:hypothetical protein
MITAEVADRKANPYLQIQDGLAHRGRSNLDMLNSDARGLAPANHSKAVTNLGPWGGLFAARVVEYYSGFAMSAA